MLSHVLGYTVSNLAQRARKDARQKPEYANTRDLRGALEALSLAATGEQYGPDPLTLTMGNLSDGRGVERIYTVFAAPTEIKIHRLRIQQKPRDIRDERTILIDEHGNADSTMQSPWKTSVHIHAVTNLARGKLSDELLDSAARWRLVRGFLEELMEKALFGRDKEYDSGHAALRSLDSERFSHLVADHYAERSSVYKHSKEVRVLVGHATHGYGRVTILAKCHEVLTEQRYEAQQREARLPYRQDYDEMMRTSVLFYNAVVTRHGLDAPREDATVMLRSGQAEIRLENRVVMMDVPGVRFPRCMIDFGDGRHTEFFCRTPERIDIYDIAGDSRRRIHQVILDRSEESRPAVREKTNLLKEASELLKAAE